MDWSEVALITDKTIDVEKKVSLTFSIPFPLKHGGEGLL
jgi:hypothetical protein